MSFCPLSFLLCRFYTLRKCIGWHSELLGPGRGKIGVTRALFLSRDASARFWPLNHVSIILLLSLFSLNLQLRVLFSLRLRSTGVVVAAECKEERWNLDSCRAVPRHTSGQMDCACSDILSSVICIDPCCFLRVAMSQERGECPRAEEVKMQWPFPPL